MGYGEFGGGGSVDWRVVHGDHGQKGKDKDPQPPKGSGTFRVYINGSTTPIATTPVDGGSVRVVWDPDTKQTSDEDLADKKAKDPKPGV